MEAGSRQVKQKKEEFRQKLGDLKYILTKKKNQTPGSQKITKVQEDPEDIPGRAASRSATAMLH